MAGSPDHSLGTRTIHGMLWAYGAYVGGRAIVLVSTAILAHLLTPADFGVVALALVFMTFMETVQDLGLTQALIVASPEEEPARAQTTFVWTVAIGAVLTVAVSAFAPLVAKFFGESSLRAIIPVLGVCFLVESLGATHDSLARKHLDYRTRTFAEGADVLIRGTTGVALALAGFGAWSLVLGYLVGTIARTGTLWALVPFRPQLRFAREHLGSLARFGGVLSLVDVASALAHNMDYLFVGRVLGASSLGLYMIGFRLPELLIMNLAVVAANVLFPAYSALSKERLESGFLLSLRYIAAIVFPVGAGLALLARPIVLSLFGSKWVSSIEVMQILAVYAVFSTLNIPAGTIYKVSGRAWIIVATTVPYLVVLFLTLLLFTHQGILAVAICVTACQTTAAIIAIFLAGKILAVRLRLIAEAMTGPFIAALGMSVVVFPIEYLVKSSWAALIAGVLSGALVYMGLLWKFMRDIPERLLGSVIPRFKVQAAAEPSASATVHHG
ncbi:MAG: lipopolysaccharide biosynthesis protein [Solirubrobacteraceae bacterium]